MAQRLFCCAFCNAYKQRIRKRGIRNGILNTCKKVYPSCKTSDEKQTVLFDLSDLDRTWFTESVINQILPNLEKFMGINTYENVVFAIPVSTDIAELSIDIEFNRTHVYSEKTGKKLYTLKSVSGFRIAEYKRNIYGIVPYNSIPVSVITLLHMEHWIILDGLKRITGMWKFKNRRCTE